MNPLFRLSRLPIILLIAILGLSSCSEFELTHFDPLSNFTPLGDTLTLEMQLDGPYRAIELPPNGQRFRVDFELENISGKPQKLYYKVYFQNSSYKFKEVTGTGRYNPRSSENFYGSWIGDSLVGFKSFDIGPEDQKISVRDSFYITGNPLNDPRYFGENPLNNYISKERVEEMIANIKGIPEWYQAIKEKSLNQNISLEEQLRKDALWTLEKQVSDEKSNQRWQRNPRVGSYEFLLVVCTEDAVNRLPDYIKDPLKTDESGHRVNPFYYFQFGEGKNLNGVKTSKSKKVLRTFARLRPDMGLYFREAEYLDRDFSAGKSCSSTIEAYSKAHFQQYRNTEVRDSSLWNIDVKADIGGSEFRKEDFYKYRESSDRLDSSYVEMASVACANAWFDENINALVIENPGNENRPFTKTNAGVEGRVGFTYGKFRAKIKYPEILSDHNVWNGITCAYWLKFQSLESWNQRDLCTSTGYIQSGYSAEDAVYAHEDSYSEIDIEIVKTSKFWPSTSEERRMSSPGYAPEDDDNLIVTCTNWDLACQDPDRFNIGEQAFSSQEATYYPHRWVQYYKALTIKTERQAAQTVGSDYYYEIEWKPNELYWRIGDSPDNMQEVGAMDSSITKIPNNQMVPVMTQEFHYGHWWPTSPFQQGDIPYPASPIRGILYEIIIE